MNSTDGNLTPSLSAYLPIDRRLALGRGEKLPDRTEGTVIFADLSGFTPLTAALAEELGPQLGAEEITSHLNRVYGALIEQVHRYHGSVIDFSGDAITCWFDNAFSGPAGPLGSAGLAASCALAMQQTIRELEAITTPSGATFPLGIKVAVSCGPVRRFLVGDPEVRVFDTLAGSTLDRLETVALQAGEGEVVVDVSVAETLGAQGDVSEAWVDEKGVEVALLHDLNPAVESLPWPEAPEPESGVAGRWLLNPVLRRLERGEGEFLSELRTAVTLFVKFAGLEYDEDDLAEEKLDAYISWVQSVTTRYEGHLVQLSFGDKGSYFSVAFGALMAHEDDAARAVAAALALRRPPADLAYIRAIRMGISQGTVRSGAYGGPTRRTYGIHGSQVNIAARLMTRAYPGQILATQPIATAAREVADFQELGDFTIRGLDRPLLTFEVQRRHESGAAQDDGRGQAAAIVGRNAERADMAGQLLELQEGKSSNIIIEGEAGIGKSRLLAAFVNMAREQRVRTLIGAGSAIEQTTAYFAWRPIFQGLLGLEELDGSDVVLDTVEAYLKEQPELLERFPLLDAVLPIGLPDNELTAGMSGEVRANNTGALLIHLLKMKRNGPGPVILVFEDAHWIDSASWALLKKARRDLVNLILVVVTRPMVEEISGAPPPAEYVELLRLPETKQYLLSSLSPDEAVTLVCRRLGVRRIPESVKELVRERAEGHPFFSEEIVLALRDAGILRIENDEAVLVEGAKLEEHDFPDTIQGVITSRIDQLEPGQELALKVASVIGRVFFFRTLKDIHPVSADRPLLADYLMTLAFLDITPLETRVPELSYIFRHAIIQEVVYNLLLYTQREQLHLAVAEWYERNFPDDLSRHYPLLAYHWERANNVNKTIEYLGMAGEQALRDYANREAVEFLGRALLVEEERGDDAGLKRGPADELRQVRWLRQLGEAHLGLGQLTDSRTTLARMLARVRRPAPGSKSGVILSLLRQVLLQVGHRIRPASFLGRASGDEREVLLEAARAYQQLAEIYYFANGRAQTLNAGLNVLNLSERAGPSPELARAYANMVVIAGLIPWHGAAEAYGRRSLKTARLVGDRPAMAWTHLLLGTYQVGLGKWAQSTSMATQAIEISRQLGDQRILGLSLGVLTLVPYYTGDFEASQELYVEWHDVAVDSGNIQHRAFGLFGQAENALPQGNAEAAAEAASTGLKLLIERADRSYENRTVEIRGYGLLALANLRQGKIEPALELAGEAMAVIGQLSAPSRVTLLEGLSATTEVYLKVWESQAAAAQATGEIKAAAREAVKVLGRYARVFPIGKPRAHLWQGTYDWLDGRPGPAGKAWQESLEEAEGLGMPFDAALANFEIGRHASGGEGEAHLERARQAFESLGTAHSAFVVRED
jgi:class 3 adenylate cyclase/tetratricopeptide (TPR) repeat protein